MKNSSEGFFLHVQVDKSLILLYQFYHTVLAYVTHSQAPSQCGNIARQTFKSLIQSNKLQM